MLPSYAQALKEKKKEMCDYVNTSTDMSYMAHVGWRETSSGCKVLDFLYSPSNLQNLQKTLKELLKDVHPEGKTIVVPEKQIAEVLSNIYQNQTKQNVGDIYSRYIIPQEQERNDVQSINKQTIQAIYNMLKTQFEVEANNKKLTIWNSLYGDFNDQGLRAHPPIKIRKKHGQYMAFNMKY
jgi:hypothetical protein